MKNTMNKQTDLLQKSIDNASKTSKENIKALIDSNSKQFETSLENNSKTFNSISKALYEHELDPAIVSNYKHTLIKGLELSEDTINSIIDASTNTVKQSIELANKFTDIIKNEDMNTDEGVNKLVALVKENLDKSVTLSKANMEKMTDIYNKHFNLALNFSKKFADVINSQVEALYKLQKKATPMEMITNWWKHDTTEKVKVKA
jgi:hypothetical protein